MPLSHRLPLALPALLCAVLLFVCLAPVRVGSVTLTPSVVWLMALSVGALYPAAWGVVTAFLLGLLSDFLMGTPLGAQALLSVLLTLVMHVYARRASHQLFHVRWLEAAGALLVWHVLLWVLCGWIISPRPPFETALIAAGVDAGWFPLFYGMALLLLKLLPARS